MKGRSTCSQLLEFADDLGKSLDKTGQTGVIYLDVAKTFDKVNHCLLLYKLQKMYGVKCHLLKWLHSYLGNRRQRVVVNGS